MQIFRREVRHRLKIQKNLHLKSGQLSQSVPMLKLDYKAFVMKTGSRLKPLQNTAINDALASRNNV